MQSFCGGRATFGLNLRGFAPLLLATCLVLQPLAAWGGDAASDAAYEARLLELEKALAADALEGRGPGTQGIDVAAEFIARQFAEIGLKTDLIEGKPFQPFNVTVRLDPGPINKVQLVCPAPANSVELKLNEEFSPLALGGSGKFDAPLVFVGYGITAADKNYDDYQGIDVKGKAVIILRHEPQQNDPHSVFDGTDVSQLHAPYVRKISNAYEHGAAAVIFITDAVELAKRKPALRAELDGAINSLLESVEKLRKTDDLTVERVREISNEQAQLANQVRGLRQALELDDDLLVPFHGAGPGDSGHKLPVMHCRRAVVDALLKAAGLADLATLEAQIDVGPTPRSRELPGCRLQGEVTVERVETTLKNVIGVLEGEGPLAEETLVIGAHYDHLGRGGEGSLAPGSQEIHNGADDNASGTCSLIEIARALAARSREKKLSRRVVFIAFSGEEKGLLGSAHYCREPLLPLDKTIAMLNLDMVGRLNDNKLILQGVDTAAEFGALVDELNGQFGFEITRQPGGFGPSDHSSFYAKEVPVMHVFTGLHSDYHRPSDDVESLNLSGMRRVAQFTTALAQSVAEAPARPSYVAPAHGTGPMTTAKSGSRPYFGSIPDFGSNAKGLAISGVARNGPAAKAGLKSGDVIIKLGESNISNLDDFDSALRKHKGGDKVPVIVVRDGKETTFEVELGQPRGN